MRQFFCIFRPKIDHYKGVLKRLKDLRTLPEMEPLDLKLDDDDENETAVAKDNADVSDVSQSQPTITSKLKGEKRKIAKVVEEVSDKLRKTQSEEKTKLPVFEQTCPIDFDWIYHAVITMMMMMMRGFLSVFFKFV